MTFLSPTEQQFLNGSRQFTKAQQRYIRCRLKKKLRLLNEESRKAAAALQPRCNGTNNLSFPIGNATLIHETLPKEEERGSPSLVRIPPMILPDSIMREEEEIERRSGGPKEIRTPDPRHVKA
jgi:hypothetical protein